MKQAGVVCCGYFASKKKNEDYLVQEKSQDLWVSSSSCQWEKCVCFSMT